MFLRRTAGVLGLVLLSLLVWQLLPIPATTIAKDVAGRVAALGDWPMYGHDPQHTNHNPDETAISPATVDQLVFDWQVSIGMNTLPNASHPSVAAGTVFVGSGQPGGPNFFAFDAATGAPRWSTTLGDMPACIPVGVASSPAISGTLVAVGGADAAYYGLDALTGAVRWREPLDVGASGYAWTSPLIYDNRVYVGVASSCDNPSVRGELRALDATTGQVLARRYFVNEGEIGAGIWNSPALNLSGSSLFITTGEADYCTDCPLAQAMVALDPTDLSPQDWRAEGVRDEDQDWNTSPLLFPGAAGHMLVGAAHKNGIFYAYQADALAAGAVWTHILPPWGGQMAAYDPALGPGGTLYLFGDQIIYAVDPTTGADRWPAPLMLGSAHGNLAALNGLLLLNVEQVGVQVVDGATGQVLRTLAPPGVGPSFSGATVAGGRIYAVSGSTLTAWRIADPAATPSTTPSPVPPSASPTPVVCTLTFDDVPLDHPFYAYIHCLACRGVVSGYADGTFHPAAAVTRGQVAKILSNAAGFADPIASTAQVFEDVPPGHPFWLWIARLAAHGAISGYACGGPGEPCIAPANRAYFRPAALVTRGQLAKITATAAQLGDPLPGDRQTFADVPPANAFWPWIERLAARRVLSGYACGGPGEPCDPANRPYFRWGAETTRGQIAKIAAQTFFPNCAPGKK